MSSRLFAEAARQPQAVYGYRCHSRGVDIEEKIEESVLRRVAGFGSCFAVRRQAVGAYIGAYSGGIGLGQPSQHRLGSFEMQFCH